MFYKRLLQAPITLGESFFLFGPRGTGKTMWVKTEFPNGLYLDLLDSSLYGGERREYHDSVQVIPFEELLKELPRILS